MTVVILYVLAAVGVGLGVDWWHDREYHEDLPGRDAVLVAALWPLAVVAIVAGVLRSLIELAGSRWRRDG